MDMYTNPAFPSPDTKTGLLGHRDTTDADFSTTAERTGTAFDTTDSQEGEFKKPKKTFVLRKVQLPESTEAKINTRHDALLITNDEDDEDDEDDDDILDAHLLRTPLPQELVPVTRQLAAVSTTSLPI